MGSRSLGFTAAILLNCLDQLLLHVEHPYLLRFDVSLDESIVSRSDLHRIGKGYLCWGIRSLTSRPADQNPRHTIGRMLYDGSMDLLERDTDLGILDSALDEASRGVGSVVLVSGEAGIGKTSLVRQFAHNHSENARILWGACDDLTTPRTLGPFHDIAHQVGGALKKAVAGGQRGEVFDAVLEAVADPTAPTVVIIEDVHWADGATLDVLKFLGRRIDRVAATLVLTYRDEEVPRNHPLVLVVGDLPASAVHRVQLAPLSMAAVEAVATRFVGSAESLYTKTRGNPFLLSEALMAPAGDVPVNVRDAVRGRAARLSPTGRAVAEMISVVPSQTERWLLDSFPEFKLEALDECLQYGLIEFNDTTAWYRHELVRGAMEESLTPPRRRELNAFVLDVLSSREADSARIVHHARRAHDQPAIARYAPEAARRASAAAAHTEARAHFRIAVEYSDGLDLEDQAQLLIDYAIECHFTNEEVDGLASAERALSIWRELSDTIREGEALRWLSRLHWWLGHGDQAIECGLAAVEVLTSVNRSKELAMAYSNLAQLFMLSQQSDAAEEWATKAITAARELDDQDTLAHALNNLGSTKLRVGDLDGYALLEESLAISVRERFDDHAGRAYANLTWMNLDFRDYEAAEKHIEEGLAYARKLEIGPSIYYITAERSRLMFELGRWEQAEIDAEWVLGRPEEPGITAMPALTTLARLQVRRGDPEVDTTLQEAWRMAEPTGELQRIAPVASARAELAWLRGDTQGIHTAMADAYELGLSSQQPWIMDELAFWMWRATGTADVATRSGTPYSLQIDGDWQEAAAAWERIGCPYEQAIALLDSENPPRLLEALKIFDQLGAIPAAATLRRQLRRMGVQGVPRGPRRTTQDHPAGLTQRQVDVLKLVAEDMTNAQIADRLFVSTKTVSHHVSAILMKLEVTSRGEAAAAARDRGLL
jgi:DNA-binding CsgD family transcriptional regulator/tetratricopeptide (TPR) repeat protein